MNDKNDNLKIEFLSKIDNNKNYENISNDLKRKNSSNSDTEEIRFKEYKGMALVCLSTLVNTFGVFYTKIIQKKFPTKFHTIQFLFLRSFLIFFLSLFHNWYMKTPIIKPYDIPEKVFFFIRTNCNFFGVTFMLTALWYLRASTAQIIQSLFPIIVYVLSYFILKEKFYIRYFYGILICVLGSSIIILNEKKANSNSDSTIKITTEGTIIGVICGFIDIFFIASVNVANKVLVNAKVPVGTQMFYVSISTMLYSFIFTLFFGGIVLDPLYLFMCMIHGLFFYFGNVIYNKALQLAPLNKLIIFQYLKIVYMFILAYIFINEKIYFTDLLGALFIISFMIYNTLNPLPTK